MEFFLQQGASESGPHSLETIDEMIADGRAGSGDSIRPKDSDAWLTVEEFVDFRKYGPKDSLTSLSGPKAPVAPPPLPQDFPSHDADRPVPPIGDKNVRGAEGLTVRELEQMIRDGGRITMFTFCVSILILTFRRPSAIHLIRPGESGFGPALKYSLVSLFAGWWGFPWGPIHTIGSLITNAGGGKDLTEPLLSDLVGQSEAERIMASRTSPIRGGGLRAVGAGVAILVLAVTLAVTAIWTADEKTETGVSSGPGSAAFVAANQKLRKGGDPAGGNTAEAQQMAAQVSELVNTMHGQVFRGRDAASVNVRTHCEIHDDGCAFVLFVPGIERYKDEGSRETLAQIAWVALQSAVKSHSTAVRRLGLGVRGFGGYDRVLLGHPAAEGEELESTIESVATGPESREALLPLFAGVDPVR